MGTIHGCAQGCWIIPGVLKIADYSGITASHSGITPGSSPGSMWDAGGQTVVGCMLSKHLFLEDLFCLDSFSVYLVFIQISLQCWGCGGRTEQGVWFATDPGLIFAPHIFCQALPRVISECRTKSNL